MDPKDLSDAVRRRVSATIYNRGRMYYIEGRVGPISTDGKVVEAVVEGTSDYRVRIITEDEPVITCNCPFGGICKHAVAVALKVSEVPGRMGEDRDLDAEVDDLVSLSARMRTKAEKRALERRADTLLTEISELGPEESEAFLRRAVSYLEGTPFVEPFTEEWTRTIAELEADGAAVLAGDILEVDPERGLEAIARGRFSPGDAEALLARLPTIAGPIESDMASRARVHLLGVLGRTDELLAIIGSDAPVEAIEEGCQHLEGAGMGEECLPIVIEAMGDRTPRERRALHLIAAGLDISEDDRIDHLRECLGLWVDREVMGRLVEVSPDAAVTTALEMDPEARVLLAELLLEVGEVSALTDLALGSDDVDMVEWIAEESEPSIELAEHLTDLLLTSKGRDVLWRIRRRFEDLKDNSGLPAMLVRLRERYPRRPGLRGLLDDFENG